MTLTVQKPPKKNNPIRLTAYFLIFLLWPSFIQAQTPEQLVVLKADILADPVLAAMPNNAQTAEQIADIYALVAVPDFFVFRSRVTQAEIVGVTTPAPDNTAWSWTAYIARSQAERDAWREMFSPIGASINPSLTNVRQGLADIFSGAGGASQRAHLLVVGRRKATRIEKLLAVGTGSIAAPATMAFEGKMTYLAVQNARDLP